MPAYVVPTAKYLAAVLVVVLSFLGPLVSDTEAAGCFPQEHSESLLYGVSLGVTLEANGYYQTTGSHTVDYALCYHHQKHLIYYWDPKAKKWFLWDKKTCMADSQAKDGTAPPPGTYTCSLPTSWKAQAKVWYKGKTKAYAVRWNPRTWDSDTIDAGFCWRWTGEKWRVNC